MNGNIETAVSFAVASPEYMSELRFMTIEMADLRTEV